ncbi:hypothetical protein PEL8287_03385 [Roseovarius litorisediminis]|uniref:Uncharacterized protein n=1 Tax=Roseovarius litorisediminis TaxID=1312363 RepID=A0A1Y5TEN7_9RHOB|nr:hypothetical protein [Roseovarius litorisediminis]SLN62182.1 hypothetical protein PEL8287_03385 [Roseovarius litorisediminis]
MQDQNSQEKHQHELNMEHAKRAHDLNRQTSADFSRAAIESANLAIRSLILINGGAVIALLAFLGALEAGDVGNAVKSDALVAPIRWFALGVGFAALTALLAYLVNMLDSDITNSVNFTWEHPYIEPDKEQARLIRVRCALHVIAILLAISALGSFFFGIASVTQAVSSLNI